MPVRRSGRHGRTYVERPRLDEAGTAGTDADRRRGNHGPDGRFVPSNSAAEGRGAKAVIERPEEGLSEAPGAPELPDGVAALVSDVRTLYRASKTELGSHSPFVLTALAEYARESVLSGALMSAAMREGITSEHGMKLLDLAQRAAQRSERASLHALTLSTKLGSRKKAAAIDATPWLKKDQTK